MRVDRDDLKEIVKVLEPENGTQLGERRLSARDDHSDLRRDVQILGKASFVMISEIKLERAAAGEKSVWILRTSDLSHNLVWIS